MEPVKETNTLVRGLEIAKTCAVYFLFYKLNKHKGNSFGQRIRLACEKLGLTFIKLGQILSTRYDLLERADCEELQKLLDEVPPMPYETVREIFISDFGKPPEKIYAEFNPELIAAASIAQVYKAKLHSGETVAIKVRRPDVDRAIRSDLKIFRQLARIAQWFSPTLRHINLVKILNQLEDWLLAEVDLKNEIENLEKVNVYYQTLSEKSDGEFSRALVFPRPFREFSSVNILVMSYIEGIPMRQFKTVLNNPDYDVRASLEALMRAVMRAWVTQDELLFHGDPHPSNLILLPNGKIGLLDFGLVGRFNHKDTKETRELFLAVYSRNVKSSTELALKMCKAPASLNTPRLQEEVQEYINQAPSSGLGFWFTGFMHVFIKNRIPMPYQLVLFGRCQTILDGVFETAFPGLRALDILDEELRRGLRQHIIKNIFGTDFAPIMYILSQKLKNSPEKVASAIDKYFDDPLQIVRDLRDAVGVNR